MGEELFVGKDPLRCRALDGEVAVTAGESEFSLSIEAIWKCPLVAFCVYRLECRREGLKGG